MKTHCMIDLETLGTSPGSVIMSIGAVAFNQEHTVGVFYSNISVNSCVNAGMVVDAGAIKFWMTQTKQGTREDLFINPRGLREVLHDFTAWWKASDCEWLWSHGSNFDTVHLDVAYRMAGYGDFRPWPFRGVRDTRTLFSLAKTMNNPPRDPEGKHNALADALYQVLQVRGAYAVLGQQLESN